MANPKKKPRANPSSAGEPSPAELLLEIGTEELPYQFIPPALRTLGDSATHLLKEHRLPHGAVHTFGTPRRLVLVVPRSEVAKPPRYRKRRDHPKRTPLMRPA